MEIRIMGVVVKIVPMRTVTENGKPATVTGIDLTSGDPFQGTIEYEPGKERDAMWRWNGMLRDGPPAWNLDLENPWLDGLVEAATKLGASR
jgi:hypothetical protein